MARIDYPVYNADMGIGIVQNAYDPWVVGGTTLVKKYAMRANELGVGLVTWEVLDEPDWTGTRSPFPPGLLSDIVLVGERIV